ncbi:MAG: trehalose-phosphatase [Clostridia bacterium]|nr:trehalose-phosphatase [Clostridia bacterium]
MKQWKKTTCNDRIRQLLDRLQGSGRIFLFLDYDGTLVPIAPTPDQAVPSMKTLRLLENLCLQENLRVAVVSGRPLGELEALLPVPGLILVGVHGAEVKIPTSHGFCLRGALMTSQHGEFPQNKEICFRGLALLAQGAKELLSGRRGFLLEEKGHALALHYRLASPPEAIEVLNGFQDLWQEVIQDHHLEVIFGKKVVEIRPQGINKKLAVEALWPSWPGSVAVYIGDDTTDEDGFQAVVGRGMGVLVAEEERPTAARFRLKDPADVIELLQEMEAIT